MKLISGRDDSFSVYDHRYAQGYHSSSLGARTETLLKHIYPAHVYLSHGYDALLAYISSPFAYAPQSIPSHGVDSASQACMNLISHPAHSGASSADSTGVVSTHLFTCSSTPYATQPDLVSRAPAGGVAGSDPSVTNIFDVCFGLGYSSLLSMHFFHNADIYSPELDYLLPDLLDFPYGLDLRFCIKGAIHSLIFESSFSDGGNTLHFMHGNALDFLAGFSDGFFDIVYQDPFSAKSNPELWDEHYFKTLHDKIRPGGIVTTYAKARNILDLARDVGFGVHKYDLGTVMIRQGF